LSLVSLSLSESVSCLFVSLSLCLFVSLSVSESVSCLFVSRLFVSCLLSLVSCLLSLCLSSFCLSSLCLLSVNVCHANRDKSKFSNCDIYVTCVDVCYFLDFLNVTLVVRQKKNFWGFFGRFFWLLNSLLKEVFLF